MPKALAKRVGQALVTLLVSSVAVWSLLLAAPGSPARRVLLARGVHEPTTAQIVALRAEMGLDGTPWSRYGDWLSHAVRGDLGLSWTSGRPVTHEFATRLPATVTLTVAAMTTAVAAALIFGCVAGAFPRRWPDTVIRIVSLGLIALPGFVVGTMLIEIVVVRWGHGRVIADGTWSTVALPALTLALGPAAVWSRLLRAGLLEARRAPYLDVARARGASRVRLLLHHALPGAGIPLLTVLGTGTAALLGGAAIVETVFTWPGVGAYAVEAIAARDIPVIQGVTLLGVLTYVVVSMLVDIAAVVIDPRIAAPAR